MFAGAREVVENMRALPLEECSALSRRHASHRFGAYASQGAMTTCEDTPPADATSPLHMTRPTAYMQGIIGLSFAQETSAGSPPFLEQLFAERPGLDPLFGLQCCGFDRGVGLRRGRRHQAASTQVFAGRGRRRFRCGFGTR